MLRNRLIDVDQGLGGGVGWGGRISWGGAYGGVEVTEVTSARDLIVSPLIFNSESSCEIYNWNVLSILIKCLLFVIFIF